MLAFVTSILEIVGLALKAILKSCRKSKHEKPERSNTRENQTEVETDQTSQPKKHRRASITQKKVQTTEITTTYELSGSGGSTPSPHPTENPPTIQF